MADTGSHQTMHAPCSWVAGKKSPFADLGHGRLLPTVPPRSRFSAEKSVPPCAPHCDTVVPLARAALRQLIRHRSRFPAHSSVSNNAPFFEGVMDAETLVDPASTRQAQGRGWCIMYGPVRWSELWLKTLFRLNCCERKTLFRLKK